METANSRMDNLMSEVTNNRLGIKLIQNALEELKIGINSLVNGQLSPLLIPQPIMESTINDIKSLL